MQQIQFHLFIPWVVNEILLTNQFSFIIIFIYLRIACIDAEEGGGGQRKKINKLNADN